MIDFRVRNFQSIKDACIRVEGLTLLVGETSAGKSAFVRAISAATQNRFQAGQVRYGEDLCEIDIRYPESKDVLQVFRTNANTKMKLGDVKYEKIGRDVPLDIEKYLNFGKIEVGNDKYNINITSQFQKPLLLEFSQKKVMEVLSASTAFTDLKNCQETLNQFYSELKGSISTVNTIADQAAQKLHAIESDIDSIQSLINEADALDKAIQSLELKQESLTLLQTKVKEYNFFQQHHYKLTSWLMQFEPLAQGFSELEQRESKLRLALIDINSFSELNSKISVKKRICEQLTVIDSEYQVLNSEVEQLSNVKLGHLKSIVSTHALLDDYRSRISECNKIIVEHICPICGSKFEDHGDSENH